MPDMINQQNILADMAGLDRIVHFAELMASAKASIPQELQNNTGDCLAVCLQAAAWQMNPFAVAQKTHVIKGKLGYEAQLVNAVITRWAPIQGRLSYTFSDGWERITGKTQIKQGKNGDYQVPAWAAKDEEGLWCEVSGLLHDENQPRTLRVMLTQAWPRQSTNWANDPKQQLAYAAVKRWARLHCPDVILGIYTPEELNRRDQPASRQGSQVERVLKGVEEDSPEKKQDTLQMTLDALKTCHTEEELRQCGKDLNGLISPEHLEQVRQAFSERLKSLKTAGD